MADKIANFEDYVKRESRNKDQVPDPAPEEVRQETMEIQIEDPFQFLNEQEREEYLLRRQKEQQKDHQDEEPIRQEKVDPVPEPAKEPENAPRQEMSKRADRDERDYDRQRDYDRERNYDRERDQDRGRDYDEDYDEDEAEQRRDARIRRAVRIASALTGIIILAFVGLFIKIMVYDRYFAPNPDEVVNVSVAIPDGYTLTNDTVVVTTNLNIRSGPGTDSEKVGTVAEGTTLKRIAVANDGSWALIEYDGQYCYAYMGYLEPN